MQARRIRFIARGELDFENFDLEKPADDEILVQTLYTTISPGTERAHLLAEDNTVTKSRGFPFYPGYSNIARIIEAGAAVRHLRPGQVVATSLPHVSHGLLVAAPGAAPRPRANAIPADRMFSPSQAVFALPDGIGAKLLKECSTYCFSRVAIEGVRQARIELGEAVLVLGLGPIGLQCVQYAKLNGGFPVLAIDPAPERRRIAQSLGADGVYAGAQEFSAGHPMMTASGPSVVIEATGLPQVIPQAFQLCGRNGRVMLLGSTRGATESVNFYTDVHKKGLVVTGVHASTRPPHDSRPGLWTAADDVSLILKLICGGRVDCAPLLTHEFPAGRAAEAYRVVRERPEAIAVVLDWTV